MSIDKSAIPTIRALSIIVALVLLISFIARCLYTLCKRRQEKRRRDRQKREQRREANRLRKLQRRERRRIEKEKRKFPDLTEQEIATAVSSENLKVIQLCAARLSNLTKLINAQGKQFYPLHLACHLGKQKVVDAFIEAQADLDLGGLDGESPLMIAAQQGHQAIVDSLIKAQADINIQRSNGDSLLNISLQNGHREVVDSLIKAQADVNLQNITGESVLYTASNNGDEHLVQSLIEAGADVDLEVEHDGRSPLYIAAHLGHDKTVRKLIKAQANVDHQAKNGYAPLHAALRNGHHQVVQSLIRGQADVDLREKAHGSTPLYIASESGHAKIVASLIKDRVDVDCQQSQGYTPLYIASEVGHQQVVDLLIKAQADPNLQALTGETPLYIASQNGHSQIVDLLIKAQAAINLQANNGLAPLDIARRNGHQTVVEALSKAQADQRNVLNEIRARTASQLPLSEMVPSEGSLSIELHAALSSSGFVKSRAALLSAAADVLQEILRRRLNYHEIFVVGSYSEGWGNSLKTLDGRTDTESDIDVMKLIPGRIYHPAGLCECGGAPAQHELENGHIQCAGFASNPAFPYSGSALRPALDLVTAGRLCCYPSIAPLQPLRLSKSNIPDRVHRSLRNILGNESLTPCHVVHAASPGRAGHELRVSTSFLERRMLRSLTTLQGQLFVILKYLVKKVICHKDGFNEQGLKPYHVKTITFRMVEETPANQWKPENLVSLTRRSLQMLLDCVECSRTPGNAHGRIMEHFFLSDVAVYRKGAGGRDKSMEETIGSIANTLRTVMEQLPRLLLQFVGNLRPVSESGMFYFHPFQILPDLSPMPLRENSCLEYFEIYDLVRECIRKLCVTECSPQFQESLTALIARLPDCARTAREALRALACLKFGDREAAERVVIQCRGHSVSRGILWSAEKSHSTEPTVAFVWRYLLMDQDSAWKFCFEFDRRPKLGFLFRSVSAADGQQQLLHACFPLPLESHQRCYYQNFSALLWALRLTLKTESEADVRDWIQDVADRTDADAQELLVASLFSSHEQQAFSICDKLRRNDARDADYFDLLSQALSKKWQNVSTA